MVKSSPMMQPISARKSQLYAEAILSQANQELSKDEDTGSTMGKNKERAEQLEAD
jgi:hypothetical protein